MFRYQEGLLKGLSEPSFTSILRPPDKSAIEKLFPLFLIQNIYYGYSKEPSQGDGSLEHPKHMFKLIGKEIITI